MNETEIVGKKIARQQKKTGRYSALGRFSKKGVQERTGGHPVRFRPAAPGRSGSPLTAARRAPASARGSAAQVRDPLRLSEHVLGDGPSVANAARELGLEGTVAKVRDEPYRSGRSETWLKI
jgi:hypothetical protein